MKSFKTIFESIKKIDLKENIQQDLKTIFKDNKEFDKLKKAAKKNEDDIPDFLDYIYNIIGDKEIEKMSKKYKLDFDSLAKEFLK